MQAGPERHWNQERHPVHQPLMPWVGNTAGIANENVLSTYLEKDSRSLQSANMENSTAYDPYKKYLYSELPASAHYLPNTSYNKSSQSLSATKYGSHVRKIQNLLQEMEQDEEQRLAQIKRDSKLLLTSGYDPRPTWSNTAEKRNLLSPVNRSASLGRHKSSPGLNSAYYHELQGHDRRRSYLARPRLSELEVPYEAPSKDLFRTGNLDTHLVELEVPNSQTVDVVAELDVPHTVVQPHQRLQVHADGQINTTDDLVSSFADVDIMISNSRRLYNGHRSPPESGRRTSLPLTSNRSHHSSKSNLIELDASPLNLVAELPTEYDSLSPIEQRSTPPSRYGDRRFRTLPGEAYPLIERESPSRSEHEPQKLARTKKQDDVPLVSNNVNHFIQPSIDPRTGSSYAGT